MNTLGGTVRRTLLYIVIAAVVAVAALPFVLDPERDVLDAESRRQAPGQFVTLSQGVTHYQLAGPADAPVVVFVHGATVPYYIWDTTFAAVAGAGYRALRYDMYGRGWSDRPEVAYDRALWVGQLRELLDALGITTPVVVAGLSMGGAIAIDFADAWPAAVAALVLVDPMHEGNEPGLLRWPLLGDWLMAVRVAPNMAPGQMDDFHQPERFPGWVDRYRPQMRFKGFRRASLSALRNYLATDPWPGFERVGARGVATLLVWGEQDTVVPFAGAERVRAALSARLIAVPACGHIPQVECPEQVNPAVLEFLATLPPPPLAAVAPAACEPAPALRLDHVPVAVNDLDGAADTWQRLGFALKPGRPHDNGITNRHVKFADGTEIELITAPAARDALTQSYVNFLQSGDGGAFLALYPGPGGAQAPGAASFPRDHPLAWIFFGALNRSPTDLPEHFEHPNTAITLQSVWLAADDHGELLDLLARFDARPCDDRQRVLLAAGDQLRLLPAAASLPQGRHILGVTVTVRDLESAAAVLASSGLPFQRRETADGATLLVAPAHASGLWLELREAAR